MALFVTRPIMWREDGWPDRSPGGTEAGLIRRTKQRSALVA